MSRAPMLTANVLTSLEALLESLKPADYLGTDKEVGVKYMTALVKHQRDPATLEQRQKQVRRTIAHRTTARRS